jgi:hypothetical protein
MKRTYEDGRQEVWVYNKRRFSIVDTRVLPRFGASSIPTELSDAFEEVMDQEIPRPYEVADVTTGIVPIGRFRSGEEAVEFIREYCDTKVYKLRRDI